uniref:UDP-glucosyltransferase UGT85A54 n=1 Tax=Polygala tenuifolia TaxID=355332 RepID=A0A3G3NBH7_9FABA|nr:UDP-glucosyltransferase UGT85A54 [Polygala tenuifolia]
MGSLENTNKPHAVCIPYPAQGHINPMLKLAKILYSRGFHITFVNTEFNHRRLLKSRGPDALNGFPSFRFETIPDGLPYSDADATQDVPSLCYSTSHNCLAPFKKLLHKLNQQSESSDVPPVTCIVSDGVMSFTVDAAEELGLPVVLFWTPSACGFMSYLHYSHLIEKGLVPLKEMSQISDGYMDSVVNWIPGMKDMRLRDIPSFIRTTDINDVMLNYILGECSRAPRASAIVMNTFDDLENDILKSFSCVLSPPVYSIGPLQLLLNQVEDNVELKSLAANLWKEEPECLDWLETKEPNSVVYVNFGSITTMTNEQLVEFAWGLANSRKPFLWVIRPDLVGGDTAVVPAEFVTETKDRGLLASWCPQEQVLKHSAVGGFLTHNGWNSTLESICGGVPMLCWPFFAEQQTNCRYCCTEWGIGMEIEGDVKRDGVEDLVRELMDGPKGKEMRIKATEWKTLANQSVQGPNPTSCKNLNDVISKFLLSARNDN